MFTNSPGDVVNTERFNVIRDHKMATEDATVWSLSLSPPPAPPYGEIAAAYLVAMSRNFLKGAVLYPVTPFLDYSYWWIHKFYKLSGFLSVFIFYYEII